MIKKKTNSDGTTRITFAVDDARPVSVVGDFNEWNPHSHPLVRRSNGTRSASVTVPNGTTVFFRYLAEGGDFYDDPNADAIEPNGIGGSHSVVTVPGSA